MLMNYIMFMLMIALIIYGLFRIVITFKELVIAIQIELSNYFIYILKVLSTLP